MAPYQQAPEFPLNMTRLATDTSVANQELLADIMSCPFSRVNGLEVLDRHMIFNYYKKIYF